MLIRELKIGLLDADLLKALPPKEELQRVFEESSKKEEKE